MPTMLFVPVWTAPICPALIGSKPSSCRGYTQHGLQPIHEHTPPNLRAVGAKRKPQITRIPCLTQTYSHTLSFGCLSHCRLPCNGRQHTRIHSVLAVCLNAGCLAMEEICPGPAQAGRNRRPSGAAVPTPHSQLTAAGCAGGLVHAGGCTEACHRCSRGGVCSCLPALTHPCSVQRVAEVRFFFWGEGEGPAWCESTTCRPVFFG